MSGSMSATVRLRIPEGEFIAGPLREQEGILYAEIDPVQIQAAKWDLVDRN